MTLLDNVTNLTLGSHKRVNVKCDVNTSEKCKHEYTLEYRQYLKFVGDNTLRCIYCRNVAYSGRNNSNCKYKYIDDSMFKTIDSPEKAWLLGWIASDGCISKRGVSISIRDYYKDVLDKINIVFSLDLPIYIKG
jgi:hypothetical protein